MKRGRYYQPPSAIRQVPGVEHTIGRALTDEYKGSAEALVQTGIASLDMFPGQPGAPVGTVTYRPLGCADKSTTLWKCQPGYMTIYRHLAGTFRIIFTVSAKEQERRAAELNRLLEQEESQRRAGWRTETLEQAETRLGPALAAEIRRAVNIAVISGPPTTPVQALREMCVEHRRRLPAGWTVVAGGRQS